MQETCAPTVPILATKTDSSADEDEDRKAILDNILAMVPDHEARLQSLQVGGATGRAATNRSRFNVVETFVCYDLVSSVVCFVRAALIVLLLFMIVYYRKERLA